MKLRDVPALLKRYSTYIYLAIVGALYLLWRKEKDLHYEAEAKQVAAEKRGEANELEKQTKEAEDVAADSRAEYERVAAKHREGK